MTEELSRCPKQLPQRLADKLCRSTSSEVEENERKSYNFVERQELNEGDFDEEPIFRLEI